MHRHPSPMRFDRHFAKREAKAPALAGLVLIVPGEASVRLEDALSFVLGNPGPFIEHFERELTGNQLGASSRCRGRP